MNINESTNNKKTTTPEVAKTKDIKILGTVQNLINDGKTYFVGSDGDSYYLFIGRQCDNPNDFFTNYDMWDDVSY